MKKHIMAFGQKMKEKKLHSWHIGLLLAGYNFGIIFAFALLAIASFSLLPLWVYLFVISPIFFTVFWLWFSQKIIEHHHAILLHDSLVIAKLGVLPFVSILALAIISFEMLSYMNLLTTVWGALTYYSIVFSVGSIFLELTVMIFGLHHRIRITQLRS
ncbi:MAG TPA: hypothetical protein VJB65_05240 [Patescibacteria group bacterium]|nr:hypothetical protein [Patescibacteria group bacterium]